MPRRPSTPHSVSPTGKNCNDIQIEHPSFADTIRNINTILKSSQTHIITGIVLCAFAFFWVVAYISFFFTGSQDVSALTLSAAERAENNIHLLNVLGVPGARLSNWLINGAFGVSSIIFAVLAVLFALRLFSAEIRTLRALLICIFLIVWGSITTACIQLCLDIDTFIHWGGAHGEWIAGNMISYMHTLGTIMVLLLTLIIFLIVTDRHFLPHMQRCWQWIVSTFTKKQPATVEDDTPPTTESPVIEEIPETTNNTIDLSINNGQTKPADKQTSDAEKITVEVAPIEPEVPVIVEPEETTKIESTEIEDSPTDQPEATEAETAAKHFTIASDTVFVPFEYQEGSPGYYILL